MSDDLSKQLLLEAQLKTIAAKMDVKNPLADIKDRARDLIDALTQLRNRPSAADPSEDAKLVVVRVLASSDQDAREFLNDFEAVRGKQIELTEHVTNALARMQEVRAHIALANQAMAKLIATVTQQVEAGSKKAAMKIEQKPAGDALRLQIHVPGLVVREETFDQDIVKVGSLPSSHLRLESDHNVSRMHAVMERIDIDNRADAKGWYVIDLGSAAGTIVNDKKINKAKLMVGDTILFGGVNIRVLG